MHSLLQVAEQRHSVAGHLDDLVTQLADAHHVHHRHLTAHRVLGLVEDLLHQLVGLEYLLQRELRLVRLLLRPDSLDDL